MSQVLFCAVAGIGERWFLHPDLYTQNRERADSGQMTSKPEIEDPAAAMSLQSLDCRRLIRNLIWVLTTHYWTEVARSLDRMLSKR